MSIAVLEFNDSELTIVDAGRVRAGSPGFATVQADAVVTGSAARERSRLDPRNTHSQFWMRLGTNPLPNARGTVRHNADLAFLHLQHLHEKAGRPAELVLAVPGSWSREQLALLLGIAQRCAFRPTGLVDSALAAAGTQALADAALHIELHLHQCVLTRLVRDGELLVRESVRALPDVGLLQLQERWARGVAHAFVQQSRFDPMHSAPAEQQLYDRMPSWMHELAGHDIVGAELGGGNASYHAKLRVADFLDAAAPLYAQVADAVAAEDPATTVLLGARLAALPRIRERLAGATVLPPDAAAQGCVAHAGLIRCEDAALRFVTRLPAPPRPRGAATAALVPEDAPAALATPPEPAGGEPTHAVIGARAFALAGTALYLEQRGGEFWLAHEVPREPLASLTRDGAGWWLAPTAGERVELEGNAIRRATRVEAGQRIVLPARRGAELLLVEEIRGPADGA